MRAVDFCYCHPHLAFTFLFYPVCIRTCLAPQDGLGHSSPSGIDRPKRYTPIPQQRPPRMTSVRLSPRSSPTSTANRGLSTSS